MNRKTISFTKDSLNDLVPTSNMQWEDIQKNTFTNWVNEQLKTKGIVVRDIRSELSEHLSTLVEVLQRQPILGITNRSDNQYARLQNITVALEAITSDGVRIVSIDSSDIADGNLKLILALIWQLILRYQIGNANIQNKSWLLAWIQAVIPQCKVTNLTTDWNDGLALNALLDFCMPGLSSHWRSLDRTDKANNCHYAMKLARQQFGIPLILRPEHLASTDLDELSSITYLSYFIKVGSPGYNATLQRIQPMVHNVPVFNFTTDWNDGRVLTELVTNLGARIQDTSHTNISEIQRLQEGIDGATQLGVEPLLTASDIAEEDQEHIGIMAYAAKFLYLKPGNSTVQSTSATNGVTTLYEEERRVTSRSIPNFSHRKTTLSSYPVNGEVDSYKISTSSDTRSSADYTKPISVDTNQHSPMLYRSQNGPLTTYHIDSNKNFDDTEDSFVFQRIPSLRKEKGKKHKTDTLDTVSGIKVDTYSVGVIISTTSHEIISKDEVIVEAESPSGRVVKLTGDGNYNAQFTPDEIGEWKVSLFCHGKLVDTCPIDVCDPSQVKVTGLKGGLVNKKQYFTVDCQNAGKGDLEVYIDFRGTKVPCTIRETQTGVYTASYLPYICGVYRVSVSFNKSEIRDSDYLLGSDSDGMHRRAIFSTSIEPDRDKYNVKSTCDWQIDYITGGPFEVFITDKADIKVYSMQDGTVCNFPHLVADCSGLDPGRIEAHVSYKGYRFPANTVEDDPGIYRITFQPRGKGTYKIWIVFDGRMVKGSPFTQEIEEIAATAVGEGLRRGREGHEAKFKIDARGFPGELSVTIDGPHYPINCNVVANDDGTHTATYVPEEAGPHRIHVKLDGKNIEDSPFRPLIVDPSKIRVSGGWEPLLDEHDRIPLIVNKEKQIPFDASEAGLGELTAEVHGPSYKVPVAIDSRIGGKHTLIFTPKEEGRHYIDVKWCDFPISPKPFLGYAVWLPESDNQHQPVLSPLVVMQPKQHHSSDPGHLHNSPNRVNGDELDGPWVNTANTKPTTIYVTKHKRNKKKRFSSGSSTSSSSSDDSRKKAPHSKITLLRKVVDEPKIAMVRRVQDDPKIAVVRRVPDDPKITLVRRVPDDPRITVIRKVSDVSSRSTPRVLVPRRTGSLHSTATTNTDPERVVYRTPRIYTTYVANSPSRSSSSPSPSYKIVDGPALSHRSYEHSPIDPSKVILSGKGLKEAFANKEATFNIDGRNAGPGEPATKMFSPKYEIPIEVRPFGPKQYRCTYIPAYPGAYLLDIKWNDRKLKCCPFKINVNPPFYPEKVNVSGANIKGGTVGKDFHLQIDPRKAGKGKLTAKCTGPSNQKVAVSLVENIDGTTKVSFKPVEAGRHIMAIKYNKEHVLGSPYAIDIRVPHHSGIVYVHGPGIENNGVLGEYESHFWVDARDAGSGELNVSVMGPKGAFNVEMKRDSQKDRIFHCRYNPHEPGTYTINCKWSGHHVGNSPYRIHLGVSKDDLDRFLFELQHGETLLY
ncbi:filamin-C-like isoform X2 [Mytilus californianus]|uniref:filamin-C-like isoform X2 n=1 Tax=Mytilus californianus TaxID=6549 RepID=UPI002245F33D|nr:filamin-C-like isoform X2 [Mytilus californianus]